TAFAAHPPLLSLPTRRSSDLVVDSAEGGLTFIAMEYVRGTNLKELLLRGHPLSLDQVVHIVSQVADGLDYAHGKGVIHRDIKPRSEEHTSELQSRENLVCRLL